MVPSTRRKMELRLEFERILSYVPTDVYYTLFKAADNYREEKMVQDKLNLLNEEFKKDDTKRRTFTGKVSETLYNQKMI